MTCAALQKVVWVIWGNYLLPAKGREMRVDLIFMTHIVEPFCVEPPGIE